VNSNPRIESWSYLPEESEEDVLCQPSAEEEEWQQVDSLRIARLSRAQARCEGALSETPGRGGQLVGDKA
jgi:hypothetical protein